PLRIHGSFSETSARHSLYHYISTLTSSQIGQPVPTGTAGATLSISSATTTGTTTTKGGITSVLSSVVHGATGSSSAAGRPLPASPAGFGFAWVGLGAWAIGVASFALFAV